MARKDQIRSQIRLPAKLWDALTASAQQNNRSTNGELVSRLLSTFEGLTMDDDVQAEPAAAHFKIRLPADVLRAIQLSAERNKRSATAEIVAILQEFVASMEKAP